MKVVFIINSVSAQRCIKRVEEFIAHGYEIEAYGFSRKMDVFNKPEHFSLEIVGSYDNSLSFIKRIPILKKGIAGILRKHRDEPDTIYYLFQLDIALVFSILTSSRRYIYEESDLMHYSLKNNVIKSIMECWDKRIIRRSLISVFTSEGFLEAHYGLWRPKNTFVIPNRLNVKIEEWAKLSPKSADINHLKIGFVGFPRYESVIRFVNFYCRKYPSNEFHFYGYLNEHEKNTKFKDLLTFSNCFFHGAFKNPDDLPTIYNNIDLVLSTYDAHCENVRYAEPNKLYEAIYFETPIIVSSKTFLADKVTKLNVGYVLDPFDEDQIEDFIFNLSNESLFQKISACRNFDKRECLNINDDFFERISTF